MDFLHISIVWKAPIIPLAPVTVCLCLDIFVPMSFGYGNSTNEVCWIVGHKSMLFAFGIPVAIMLLVNVVFFIRTSVSLYQFNRQIQTDVDVDRPSTWNVIITIKIATLMGFMWITGILAMMTEQKPLWYAFNISNGLQGIAIGFCVHTEYVENLHKWLKR